MLRIKPLALWEIGPKSTIKTLKCAIFIQKYHKR